MKVIDLLNKIANGEETKSIKYKGGTSLTYYLYDKFGRECDDINLANILNDEVEIIEEDKKIEKLYIRDRANDILIGRSEKKSYATVSMVIKEIALKINEIIDKVNQGEDK